MQLAIALTRNRRLYALGARTIHGQRLNVTLRLVHHVAPGVYRVTIAFMRGSRIARLQTRVQAALDVKARIGLARWIAEP